ncbi:MAG: hypothetical protein ACYDAY_08925 [Candidatus Dormibacteria bacterium]
MDRVRPGRGSVAAPPAARRCAACESPARRRDRFCTTCGELLPSGPGGGARWRAAGLAAVLALAVGGGTAFAVGALGDQVTPQSTVQKFIRALENQDSRALSETVIPEQRSQLSGQFGSARVRVRRLDLATSPAGDQVQVVANLDYDLLDNSGKVVASRSAQIPLLLKRVGISWYITGGVSQGPAPSPSPDISVTPSPG